jgi:hypothetical protein
VIERGFGSSESEVRSPKTEVRSCEVGVKKIGDRRGNVWVRGAKIAFALLQQYYFPIFTIRLLFYVKRLFAWVAKCTNQM